MVFGMWTSIPRLEKQPDSEESVVRPYLLTAVLWCFPARDTQKREAEERTWLSQCRRQESPFYWERSEWKQLLREGGRRRQPYLLLAVKARSPDWLGWQSCAGSSAILSENNLAGEKPSMKPLLSEQQWPFSGNPCRSRFRGQAGISASDQQKGHRITERAEMEGTHKDR